MNATEPITLVHNEDELYEIHRAGEKIGTAILYVYPDHVMIDNIDVDAEHQNQGVGRAVVRLIKAMPGITAITGDSVPDAMPFWLKMGAVFDWGDVEKVERDGVGLIGFEISWKN